MASGGNTFWFLIRQSNSYTKKPHQTRGSAINMRSSQIFTGDWDFTGTAGIASWFIGRDLDRVKPSSIPGDSVDLLLVSSSKKGARVEILEIGKTAKFWTFWFSEFRKIRIDNFFQINLFCFKENSKSKNSKIHVWAHRASSKATRLFLRVLQLCFENKWNLTSQLYKLRLSSWLVTLASGPSSNHLSDSLSSQLVKSTWKVTPLKSHPQAVPRTFPEGCTSRGVRSRSWPKKRSKSMTFLLFCPTNFGCKWCSWNYFAISTTRGQTATWQCCCGVGGFFATTQPWLRVQTHRKVRYGQAGVWVASSHGLLFGGSDRGFVCRKFLWAYSSWGQWCASRWKYASRYRRDQHVDCITYESRIHTTHAWNPPQVEWSKFQWNIGMGGLGYET